MLHVEVMQIFNEFENVFQDVVGWLLKIDIDLTIELVPREH